MSDKPDTSTPGRRGSAEEAGSPTLREQLAAALAEVARLKNMARTPRAPIKGALGGIIQDLRETQGIRLRELALKSGVAAGLLSRLERCADANLTFHNLVKIARGLKTPVSAIIARWESENAKGEAQPPAKNL